LTVRAFCEREGVPESSFYHWRRELAERDKAGTGQQPGRGEPSRGERQTPLFLPVCVKDDGPAAADDGVVELRLPSGHVLRGEAVEKLARLAVLLGGSPC
jgi:hypothetical protein